MAFKNMKKNIAWVKAKREAEGITAAKRERKMKKYALAHPKTFMDKMKKLGKEIGDWFNPPPSAATA
jgi:hypothetical protein